MIRAFCIGATALLCLGHAHAQDAGAGFAPPPPPESIPQSQDIASGMHYRLPSDFLPRATATVKALREAGIEPPDSRNISLDEMASRVQAMPGVPEILQRNGFDAHSFVLGMTTFGMSYAAQQGHIPPGGSIPRPEPRNMDLLHDNPQDVQALVQASGPPPPPNTPETPFPSATPPTLQVQ